MSYFNWKNYYECNLLFNFSIALKKLQSLIMTSVACRSLTYNLLHLLLQRHLLPHIPYRCQMKWRQSCPSSVLQSRLTTTIARVHWGRRRSDRFEVKGFSSKLHVVDANSCEPLVQMGIDLAVASPACTKTYYKRCTLQHNRTADLKKHI